MNIQIILSTYRKLLFERAFIMESRFEMTHDEAPHPSSLIVFSIHPSMTETRANTVGSSLVPQEAIPIMVSSEPPLRITNPPPESPLIKIRN